MQKKSYYYLFVCAVAALSGLLFGYNTSVISGVLLFITRDFELTTLQQESVVSILLIGALIGAFVGGLLADRWGRKKSLFITLGISLFGILLLMESDGFTTLLVGRFVTGLAIGISSTVVPLYIAEMSPAAKRGALVSLNQLAITIGILVAYLVNYLYAEGGNWRDMFGFALLPALVQLMGLLFIPETPSWLISHKQKKKAQLVLKKMRVLSPSLETEEVTPHRRWKTLLRPTYAKAFLIGIGMAIFQQITGINTVIYYAPRIFQYAGFESAQTAILATLSVGVINVIATVAALWFLDRVGRRPLLFTGLIGMTLSLGILGISFLVGGKHLGWIAIVALLSYVSFFAFSLGCVAWLIISEVFPLGIRGRAMGIAIFLSWVCNYLVSLTFLSLIEALGTGGTFLAYALICLLALWFCINRVPETKDQSFEQIQKLGKK